MEVSGHSPESLFAFWGESPWYPLDRGLSGPQSRSVSCGKGKDLALLGIEPWPPSLQAFTVLTYPDSF
jgi:hypothetical protein